MIANGYDDPCLPWKGEFEDSGGDRKTAAMASLFVICRKKFGDDWVTKKQIQALIIKEVEDNEALEWFGSLEDTEDAKGNQMRLGKALNAFKNRELDHIKMLVDDSPKKTQDRKFRFVPLDSGAEKSGTSGTSGTYKEPSQARENIQSHTRCDDDVNISHTASDAEEVAEVAEVESKGLDFLALDLETYADVVVKGGKKPKIKLSGGALHPWSGDIRLLTMTDVDGNLRQYDLRNKLSDSPLPPEILGAITRSPLIIHNASFDLLFLASKLNVFSDRVFCTLTASRLLSGSRTVKHGLGEVLERYLGVKLPKEHGASEWGTMLLSPEQLEYAEDDVRYLHPLQAKLEAELEKAGLTKVFQMEMDLLPVVVAMEHYGFAVDAEKLKVFGDQMRREADSDAASLRLQLSSPKLNVDSTQQLAEAFKTIGIEMGATNKDVLTALEHPLAKLVLEYRRKDNLAGKAAGLLKHVRPDGRIHARFNSLGTETGRFSSSKPNLQQVPRAAAARAPFVASGPDRKLIIADASQVELRRAAGVSKDPKMIAAFRANEDLHRKTAAAVLHKKARGHHQT